MWQGDLFRAGALTEEFGMLGPPRRTSCFVMLMLREAQHRALTLSLFVRVSGQETPLVLRMDSTGGGGLQAAEGAQVWCSWPAGGLSCTNAIGKRKLAKNLMFLRLIDFVWQYVWQNYHTRQEKPRR